MVLAERRGTVGCRGSRRVDTAFVASVRSGLFREQVAASGEPCGAMTVGHEAEVPDAVEARWQDMEQKPAHELSRIEGHDLGATLAAVVLRAEADLAVGDGDEPAVGDGIARLRASRTLRWV